MVGLAFVCIYFIYPSYISCRIYSETRIHPSVRINTLVVGLDFECQHAAAWKKEGRKAERDRETEGFLVSLLFFLSFFLLFSSYFIFQRSPSPNKSRRGLRSGVWGWGFSRCMYVVFSYDRCYRPGWWYKFFKNSTGRALVDGFR